MGFNSRHFKIRAPHEATGNPGKDASNSVYLVDASIYIYRAWHLTPKTVQSPAGQCVNALQGFALFLADIIDRSGALYLTCAFDNKSQTSARKQLDPRYKSDRKPVPEALGEQFTLCQELVETLGIPSFSKPGIEADDIIFTLATNARRCGMTTCVISADKDLAQCIENEDWFWNYARNLQLDRHALEKRFGVKPAQMADLLALCGDKSDCIPGIPGVGETTAARLLKKWGNLDMLFNQTAKVAQMKFRGAVQVAQLLQQHEDLVRKSRQLTGLIYVDELPASIDMLKRRGADKEALGNFLQQHGLSQALGKSLLAITSETP